MSEYAYSIDKNDNYERGFNSIAEAINAAKKDDPDAEYVWVGEVEPYVPAIDADDIIERLQENAMEENEYADDYLDDVLGAEVEELNKSLNEVLAAWLKKHGHEPTFFGIVNEHKYYLRMEETPNDE